MDKMYTGHTEDIHEEKQLRDCAECGGSTRIVLVDFNNRELATKCNRCGQEYSWSHDKYSTSELQRMLDVIKERRWLIERIEAIAGTLDSLRYSEATSEDLLRLFIALDSGQPAV